MPASAVTDAPPGFSLLAKPSGAACNLDCSYCFFLSKAALYPEAHPRMSEATLEAYIRQLFAAQQGPVVSVAWQGGEPTLMKLDFFRRAMALVEQHRRPGQRVQHSFQTNGLLVDEDWCRFFRAHDVLVGLSIDGPRELHDANRVDRRGQGSFAHVLKAWALLQRHRVACNILCTVNAANQAEGRRVYRFFRDELGASWLQFIPIVERAGSEPDLARANAGWRGAAAGARPLYTQMGGLVTARSVGAAAYGQFLVEVFEEWIRHDVGQVFVQIFDVTLEAMFGRHLLCVHAPVCGDGLALEHNGDLYACDHFVEPGYLRGNIHDTELAELVARPEQRAFGLAKRERLTAQCRACTVREACHGGCPKDRFIASRDGEEGHNYLCDGYARFFGHVRPAMQAMAALAQRGRAPAEVMALVAQADARRDPYVPCPCGSGRKFRFCHGAGLRARRPPAGQGPLPRL